MALLTVAPILATLLLRYRTSSSFFDLIRDPTAATGSPPYIGFLSQAGLFFWISAAAICLFASHLMARMPQGGIHSQFFRLAGLFTLLLAIDDAFLLHDFLFPSVFGISEKPVLVAYGAFLGWLLLKYRSVLRRSQWSLACGALVAFSGSIVIDYFHHPSEIRIFLEDGLKLLGIICWMTYLADLASTSMFVFDAQARTARE